MRVQSRLVINNGYYRKNGYITMSVSLLRPVLFTCAVSEINILSDIQMRVVYLCYIYRQCTVCSLQFSVSLVVGGRLLGLWELMVFQQQTF